MYTKVLPKLNAMAKEHGVSPIQAPECYFADAELGVLFMENLKNAGFDIQGKGDGENRTSSKTCDSS